MHLTCNILNYLSSTKRTCRTTFPKTSNYRTRAFFELKLEAYITGKVCFQINHYFFPQTRVNQPPYVTMWVKILTILPMLERGRARELTHAEMQYITSCESSQIASSLYQEQLNGPIKSVVECVSIAPPPPQQPNVAWKETRLVQ